MRPRREFLTAMTWSRFSSFFLPSFLGTACICIIPQRQFSRSCAYKNPSLAAGPEASEAAHSQRVMRARVTLNLISYTIKSIICFSAQLADSGAPGNYFARALSLSHHSVCWSSCWRWKPRTTPFWRWSAFVLECKTQKWVRRLDWAIL